MNFTQVPENLYPLCEALKETQTPIRLGRPGLTICEKYIFQIGQKVFGAYFYLESREWWIQEKPDYILYPEA